jgi:hypothetical protein
MMAEKHVFVASVNLPALRDTVGDEIPSSVEPIKPLLDAKSAVLVAGLGPEASARARFVFADADGARKGEKAVKGGLELARTGLAEGRKEADKEAGAKKAALLKLIGITEAAIKGAVVERDGDVVRARGSFKFDAVALAPLLAEVVGPEGPTAERAQGFNNIKQIVLAMHNFFDVYNKLPPAAIYDKVGKGLLSWRVQLLPFIGENDLYMQFHLDEPWDSQHNKKLLDKMPAAYAPPGKEKGHLTPYRVFHGKGAIFEGKKGISFLAPDGTSNTIMVVETLPLVPWSKPEDLPFDVNKPLPKLGGLHEGGFIVGMCDGSARFVKSTVSEKTLKIAIGRDDGQPLPPDF